MKPAPPLSAKNTPKAAISRRRRCQQFQSDARKHQHRRQRFQSGARWWRQSCRKYEGRLTGLGSQRSETPAWPQSKASPGYTAKLMQLRGQAPLTAVLAAVAAVLAPVTAVLAPVTAVLAPVTAVLAPMAGPGLASRSTAPSRRLACGDLAGGPPPTAHTAAAQPAEKPNQQPTQQGTSRDTWNTGGEPSTAVHETEPQARTRQASGQWNQITAERRQKPAGTTRPRGGRPRA